MPGANMGMAAFSQPDAQNLNMAGRAGGNFGLGMPLLNAPAYDNLTPKGKPEDYKEGGQAVNFDTFHGTHDKLKALLSLQQFDAAFARGNFTKSSKVRKAATFLKTSALQWWTTLLNQGVVPSTRVQFKQIFAQAWITNTFEVDVMTAWNQLSAARRQNKLRLAQHIYNISGIRVSVDAMFDAQVKRIHEYKRQFLNLLSIIHRYDCIKNMSADERKRVVPRVCIFGGKAPPGYDFAKKIVKLVHAIGEKVNKDPEVGDLLKVIFIPDYNVSVAELVIPACDLSQHISTPGTEASGTGNMKFAMNGCLILGTLDGSNIEIRDEIGQENMFTFGVIVDDVPWLRTEHRNFQSPREFQRVLGMIRDGIFGFKDYFKALCDAVDGEAGDYYLLGRDFLAYLEAQTWTLQVGNRPPNTKDIRFKTVHSSQFTVHTRKDDTGTAEFRAQMIGPKDWRPQRVFLSLLILVQNTRVWAGANSQTLRPAALQSVATSPHIYTYKGVPEKQSPKSYKLKS
ncbi:hypothetical protein L7F22_063475 [Adiantum nelumboides]|nr:hypothetical protein [Adiantum nelumboides]